MKISASFNIPVSATIEIADRDIAAAKAAGIRVPAGDDDDAWDLASWLIRSYWSREAGGFILGDLVDEGEHLREQPELIQIDDIDGVA